jgi:hypothetical protein
MAVPFVLSVSFLAQFVSAWFTRRETAILLFVAGTLKRYIETLSITGLTSNPTIFDHAISKSAAYNEDIRAMTKSGVPREDLFFQACHRRSAARSGSVQADPPPDRGRRWLGLARSVASPRL